MIKKASIKLPFFVFCTYLFLYLPVIILVLYSFNKSGTSGLWTGFSLEWYHELLDSQEIWTCFLNSFIIALFSSTLAVVLSISLVHNASRFSSKIVRMFYANIFIPDVVLSVGMLIMFSYFFVPLGFVTLIVGHTVLSLGFIVPIMYARYQELDHRLIEASYDLGASPLFTFFNVVIPFLLPAIIVSFLLSVIVSFDDFLITFFCAGSSIQTLSLYIFAMVRTGISPVVNALSTLMLLVNVILVLLISWLTYKMEKKHV